MKKYTFACGCSFDIIQEREEDSPLIEFEPDVNKIPLDCSRTWELFAKGDTKGVFQLESGLGSSTSEKLKPENIDQLSALIAIIRPGCSESFIDGKNITQHYIDRKNKIEEVSYYHQILKSSLEPTYGLLIYQEQAMQIAKDVAGFNLQLADDLRKAIGKKKPEEMAKLKFVFLEQSKKLALVTEQEAQEIFGWIEKSQRYSFNASHSYAYAYNAYLSAYTKSHFPRQFLTSYLYHAEEKNGKTRAEIRKFIANAKKLNINVKTPTFSMLKTPSAIEGIMPAKHFMLRNKDIYVGFGDIKGVGQSVVTKLYELVEKVEAKLGKPHTEWTWMDFLLMCAPYMKTDSLEALIGSGAFDEFGLTRKRMIFEYRMIKEFTKAELIKLTKLYIEKQHKDITELYNDIISQGSGREKVLHSAPRLSIINDSLKVIVSPPESHDDNPAWVAGLEESLIGASITASRVDGRNTADATSTCRDFLDAAQHSYHIIAVEVEEVKEVKTKSGKNPGQLMAFLTVSDGYCGLDNAVCFPEQWEEYKSMLVEGNLVMVAGEKDNKSSFVLKKVWQL